jgi:PTS system mannitol-specific IIC component
MRKWDRVWEGKIKPGFEMLVNNFSAGIWGMILAIAGFAVAGPFVEQFSKGAGHAVDWLVSHNLMPLASIFVEPAKVLFLNNAINHGVFTPLGINEAAEKGHSLLFLVEANPGPGFGLLLAFMFFGRGAAKSSAPGAILIQFIGGIHEIYFPYVLMKPKLILAVIAGGMTGVLTNVIFDSGLRAPAAPGSIIAVWLQVPADSFVGVTLSVIFSATVTFLVAAFLLRLDRSSDEGDLAAAAANMESMKGKKSSVAGSLGATSTPSGQISSIVFACDAGMGSSAMGASVLRKKIHGAGFPEVTVVNKAISNLTDTYDLVVTHQDLTTRARQKTGSAIHVSVENFMNSPRYDDIVELVEKANGSGSGAVADGADGAESGVGGLLDPESIVLDAPVEDRAAAISRAGRLLVTAGAVEPAYVDAMHEREASVSTFMGNGLAIPHGTNEAKSAVLRTAISFVRYTDEIEWKNKQVKFVVGIAALGDDHLKLLGRIAEVFLDAEQVARLEAAQTPDEVLRVLGAVQPA